MIRSRSRMAILLIDEGGWLAILCGIAGIAGVIAMVTL